MIKNAHFRGKDIQEDWTIVCPNHYDKNGNKALETLATVDIFDKQGKLLGMGCYKCYGNLPGLPIIKNDSNGQ